MTPKPKRHKKDGNNSTLYFRGVPKHTKDHFKALCARRGITMTDQFIKMIKEAIIAERKESGLI